MADCEYDLIVIGGGPGGYVAAIRAAQLGMRVACVEQRETLGGTCLNVGCIPSKALLQSSEKYAEAKRDFAGHGIDLSRIDLDLRTMLARKNEVVDGLTKGIKFLFGKNKIEHVRGLGIITAPGEVTVISTNGGAGTQALKAPRILIATGSESAPLPGIEIDEKRIVSSTGALSLDQVPRHLVVVGAGYIGLELGSVWRRLGARVTVIEFLDRIVPAMDSEIATHLHRALENQGMKFRLGTKVTEAQVGDTGIVLRLEDANGGTDGNSVDMLDCDVLMVAVGRRPLTDGLELDEIGVDRDNHGFIKVDENFQTSVPGIYAIGDVIPGPMLAHKAEEEGVAAVEIMAGQAGHVDYDAIPGVVYTSPEAASVGKTEEELKQAGTEYRVGKFPFSANSRARAAGLGDGLVKILADAGTDRVLGAHIFGPQAGTMIAELVMAMSFAASAEDIARTCHAHPTLNEAVKEAALAAAGRAIHS